MTDEEKVQIRLKVAAQQLNLSEEQSGRYEKVLLKYEKLFAQEKKATYEDARHKIIKRAMLEEKENSEIEKILTPEQFEKYKMWKGLNRPSLNSLRQSCLKDSTKLKSKK